MRLVQWSTQLGSIHTVDTSLAEHGKSMGGGQAAHRSSEDRPLRIRREEVRLAPVESGFYGTGKEKSQQKVLSSATKLLEYPAPPINPPPCREVSEREREAKARGKGSSGKKTLPSGPRRWRRNAKKDSDWTEEVYTNFDSSPMTGTSEVQLKSKAVERRDKHRRRRVVQRKEFSVRVKGR